LNGAISFGRKPLGLKTVNLV